MADHGNRLLFPIVLNVIQVVETFNFETDESLLTGESLPVHKECDPILRKIPDLVIASTWLTVPPS